MKKPNKGAQDYEQKRRTRLVIYKEELEQRQREMERQIISFIEPEIKRLDAELLALGYVSLPF